MRIHAFLGNRSIVSLLTAGLLMLTAASAAQAQNLLDRTYDLDIPPQQLTSAMIALSRQTGIEVLMSAETVEGMQTAGVTGELSLRQALDDLLAGTSLGYRVTGERAVSIAAAPTSSAPGQNTIGQRRPGIEEIIVTGQKREERIQDVPIAISAFSPEDLEAQKIEGGFDLLKGVPNVTFSKTNFSGYNFQIRGIGTQAVSATTDPAVAVSFNNTTLIVNRLFEQEYLDVERVEVLRGPQGTLFGRNATAGVINVISNKPEMGVWDGMIDVEVGNYNTRRLRGFFNAPLGDEWAIRGAYASTIRDGYGINQAADDPNVTADVRRDVDNRDLWTGRFSLGWQPSDRFRMNLIYERFEEDDQRVRTSKQLCHRDDNPEVIGNTPIPDEYGQVRPANLTQGCKAGSLYSDEAFGTVNGASLPYITGFFWSNFFSGFVSQGDDELILGGNPYYQQHQFVKVDPDHPSALPFSALGLPGDGFLALNSGGVPPSEIPCEDAAAGFVRFQFALDLCNPDPYGGRTQSRDLRTIHSQIEPTYRASADIVELSFDWEWSDNLLFSSQTVYVEDEYFASQDYNRYATFPVWNDPVEDACGQFLLFGAIGIPDCSSDPDTGRGTLQPLTDLDGDGIVDQTNQPLNQYPVPGVRSDTVDEDGFLRDENGHRVGFYTGLFDGNGALCDPNFRQCSKSLVVQDLSRATSTQYNQEFRLVSSYPGPWNFSLGFNYTNFETLNDYFVFSNAFNYLLRFGPFNGPSSQCPIGFEDGRECRWQDTSPIDESIVGDGHNYFRSANPYELTSSAIFGELYWNATETVKITAGLRFTWDQKVFTPIPSQLLLADYRELVNPGEPPQSGDVCLAQPESCPLTGNAVNGRGSPASPDIVQEWREPTGRIVVDWQPLLDWTDETMVYASFAHGYKGGGANPPGVAPPSGNLLALASGGVAPKTFEPEYVNAYELGTKNTLFGGALVLNATGFYYDYTDYQVSKIVDRQAVNENFDAEIWGAELETIFAPSLNWQFNAAIGWLQTEIANGERSIDLMDRTSGGSHSFTGEHGVTYDEWMVIKPWITAASNCIAPVELVEANIARFNVDGGNELDTIFCPTGSIISSAGPRLVSYFDENGDLVRKGDSDRLYDPFTDAPNNAAGFFKDLGGNEMPNSPEFTIALGAQYNFDLTRDWRATARVDYYWQDQSFARVYNTEYDRLKSWSNTNLSFWVNNPVNGITVEAYVKNVFDETPITGTFLNSDDSGLTTNVFTLDPRLIGVSIRKEF